MMLTEAKRLHRRGFLSIAVGFPPSGCALELNGGGRRAHGNTTVSERRRAGRLPVGWC